MRKEKPKTASSKIDMLLNGLIDRLEKLEDIGKEQFPEVCKEIIEEKKVELQNGIGLDVYSFLMSAVGAIMFAYFSIGDADRALSAIFMLVSFLFVIAAFISSYSAIFNLLELRVLNAAPKVIVLRELKQLIGGRG